MSDLINTLIEFESGELDDTQTIAFFQELVNSGLAWSLQGSYGRIASALLKEGLITQP